MGNFERDARRRGFGYWFSRCSGLGLGLAGLLWLSTLQAGGAADLERRYGMPGISLTLIVAWMGVSSGAIVGLLNQWVASRIAAALVGMLATLPTAVAVGWVQLSAVGSPSIWKLIAMSLLLSGIVGGMFGAILYSPTQGR